jgi:hypothetical protein
VSITPPGGNGTTTLIGLEGYCDCAYVSNGTSADAATQANEKASNVRRFMVFLALWMLLIDGTAALCNA